jgi:hypothetical protein
MEEADDAVLTIADVPSIPYRVVPIALGPTLEKQSDIHLSLSLHLTTVQRVRELAAKELLSDSAIVVAALRGLFDSGQVSDLRSMVIRIGFSGRRRRS